MTMNLDPTEVTRAVAAAGDAGLPISSLYERLAEAGAPSMSPAGSRPARASVDVALARGWVAFHAPDVVVRESGLRHLRESGGDLAAPA